MAGQNFVYEGLLGFGAVATILLSLLTGYGLLFTIGIPFSSLTQIFPYVMVGIGLDDTFILTGAYERTDPSKDPVQRIEDCLCDVGNSITISTLTTVSAFCLGCVSSLPGIRWFCLYAAPTIMIDFLYQITFLLAMMVLDSRRIEQNRYDCCVCFTRHQPDTTSSEGDGLSMELSSDLGFRLESTSSSASSSDDDNEDGADDYSDQKDDGQRRQPQPRRRKYRVHPQQAEDDELDEPSPPPSPATGTSTTQTSVMSGPRQSRIDVVIDRYANFLMIPVVKALVLVLFAALLALGILGATDQRQEFDFRDLTPPDSFIRTYFDALDMYVSRQGINTFVAGVYFRDVDFADPEVQDQMIAFVDDLTETPYISSQPTLFWINDFRAFVPDLLLERLLVES